MRCAKNLIQFNGKCYHMNDCLIFGLKNCFSYFHSFVIVMIMWLYVMYMYVAVVVVVMNKLCCEGYT